MNRNDLFGAMEFLDDKIIENSEVERTMNNKRRISRKTVILVAAIFLLAAFTTTAFATRLFGLRDALYSSTSATDTDEAVSMITLSGFTGSKEYMAAAEWSAFEEGYDPDGSILDQVDQPGPDDCDIDAKYAPYPVYTQEMADKIDEITGKYGLSLHSGFEGFTAENYGTKIGEIVDNDYVEFSDNAYNIVFSGYMYDDGTFRYDGIFNAKAGRFSVDYQFSRAAKGVLDLVPLNIGDISDYQEQMIVTDSGVELAAAISGYKAILFTEFDSCYVFVNVLEGSDMGITFDDLKDLANTFDFSVIENVKGKPAQDSQENADNEPEQDINEIVDGESEWEQSYIEVSREGVVDKIPVDTVRVVISDTTIATAPEYFTYSVYEGVHTFSYDAWEDGTSVYYDVYADVIHTPEQLADLLQQNYADSYSSVMTENTRVGSYDAVAVYCDGNNIVPDYNTHYFLIPTDYGCIVIEAHFTFEMYEGLYQIMRALFDTLEID